MNKNQLRKELNILLKEQREILGKNERLERKIKELSEKINNPEREDGEMYLYVSDSSELLIIVSGCNRIVGKIKQNGNCHIMTHENNHTAWEYWKSRGKKVDEAHVKWRGKEYFLEENEFVLINIEDKGFIYDFHNCRTGYSKDENIKRLSNEMVKLF